VTYSSLEDARSYFGGDTERTLDYAATEKLIAELKADGEGEHIIDAVRELAAFQAFRRLANRKLRAHNPRKPRLNESQTTAVEYLFGIRRLGPTSWGKFADHVNRRHRVGRYRIGRQLEALEAAGVIRSTVDRDTGDVTVELVLAGVKRAPGSRPIADLVDDAIDADETGQTSIGVAGEQRPIDGLAAPAPTVEDIADRIEAGELVAAFPGQSTIDFLAPVIGHVVDKSTTNTGGAAGDCEKCGARIAWSSTGSPDGRPRWITVAGLSATCES
jgi:hypothetical protein